MFGNAANYVEEYADAAFKSAGLSANEYLNTVNGMAAALNQATGSEWQSARLANQAVIDMADNANKMGTSMEMIQNAYNGFSKIILCLTMLLGRLEILPVLILFNKRTWKRI